ncbi:MAG: sterol desaturase family protein [Planctomycetes bacterium]|nr:sterol desaturase family protein [Planctomycetota bacterium]
MNVERVLGTAATFGVLLLVFLPLERLFPAHRQRVLRREWGTDLLFFLGQALLFTVPVVAVLTWVHAHLDVLPLAGVRAGVAAWPFWAQVLCVVALCDVGIYWAHRLSHTNAFLWRFHRVHHTAERLDWLAAYREHPLDNLYTRLVENLPAMLLGFPLEALAGFAMFRGLWALYIHSNVSLTPGPLAYLLGSSRLHHWHHEPERGGRVNFANLSPLTDLVFGTYYDPGHMPERYGLGAEPSPRSWAGQLLEPLVPRAAFAALQRWRAPSASNVASPSQPSATACAPANTGRSSVPSADAFADASGATR